MKLLTDSKFIYMFTETKVIKKLFPKNITEIDNDMVWSYEHPDIQTLSQIQEKWPQMFAIDNPKYIPNLKFVKFDLDAYEAALEKYYASEPTCGEFISEITGVHAFIAKIEGTKL